MAREEFWSVDKLMPKIRSGAFSERGETVPISELSAEALPVRTGEMKTFSGSRILRSCCFSVIGDPESGARAVNPEDPAARAVRKRLKTPLSFLQILDYCSTALQRPQKDHLQEMIWLWKEYRSDFAVSDKFFADLVFDLCLYLDLPFPFAELSPLICSSALAVKPLLFSVFLFDYLFAQDHQPTGEECEFILQSTTRMNFRRSKAYLSDPGFAGLCEKVIRQAFDEGLTRKPELNDALFNIQIPSEVKTVRRLFPQLPPRREGEIRVTLVTMPLYHDENVLERIDGIVRYAENRVRALLHIKNNLSRIAVSEPHRAFLDRILYPYEVRAARRDEAIEYGEKPFPIERPRRIEVDVDKAKRIEETSWETTRQLTEDLVTPGEDYVVLGAEKDEEFDREYAADLRKAAAAPSAGDNEFWEFAAALSPVEEKFVTVLLYEGRDEARRFAFSSGQFFEGLTAAVNTKAQDAIGDVICDAAGVLYEDYIPQLKTVFFKGE